MSIVMAIEDDLAQNAESERESSPGIIRVLHVDDDESQLMFLKAFIEGEPNLKVTSVHSAEYVIELIQTGAFDYAHALTLL